MANPQKCEFGARCRKPAAFMVRRNWNNLPALAACADCAAHIGKLAGRLSPALRAALEALNCYEITPIGGAQ